MNEYLSDSLAWSFVGAVFGYAVCFIQMKLLDRRRTNRMTIGSPLPATKKSGPHFPIIYVFFIVIGLGMTGQQYMFQRQQNETQRATDAAKTCLINQVKGITDAFQARADLAQVSLDLTEGVFIDITQAFRDNDDVAIQDALDRYVSGQKEIKNDKLKSKIPPFPNGKCEE